MDVDFPGRDQLIVRAKQQLRTRMRALRSSIPLEARSRRSRALVERVVGLDVFSRTRGVGLFHPLLDRGEVDIRPLDPLARRSGAQVFYPGLDESGLPVFRAARPEELQEQGRGFAEPPAGCPPADPGTVDLIIVPALAVDLRGHRIGYGSGFYDRILAGYGGEAIRVVVAYEFQLLAEIPIIGHDVPGNWVVSDERTVEVDAASAAL